MKIAYLYPEKLPDKKARTISVINTSCELSKIVDTTLLYEKSGNNILKFYNLKCDLKLIPISRKFVIRSNKIFNFNLKKYFNRFDFFYVRHLKTAEFLIKNNQNVVFECHEIFSLQNKKIKYMEQFVYENVKGLTFINRTLQKEINNNFNIFEVPQKVIHNGCGFELEYIKKDFTKIEEIYYIGSFQPWKGVEFLVENMKHFSNLKLNIIGDGEKTKILDIINKYNLKNINFLGYKTQKEIQNILKQSKLTVIPNIPSVFTNFSTPIKLYEYMMSSNIVLSTDMPTIKEIIEDNENGFLFKSGDNKSFIEKLNYILSLSPKKLEEITKNGYESVKDFTWKNRAKQIVSFIKELQ